MPFLIASTPLGTPFFPLEVSLQQTGRWGKRVRLCREGEEFSTTTNNNNSKNNDTCHVGSTCQFAKCIHTCGLLSFQRWGVVTLVFQFPAFVTAPTFKQAAFFFLTATSPLRCPGLYLSIASHECAPHKCSLYAPVGCSFNKHPHHVCETFLKTLQLFNCPGKKRSQRQSSSTQRERGWAKVTRLVRLRARDGTPMRAPTGIPAAPPPDTLGTCTHFCLLGLLSV